MCSWNCHPSYSYCRCHTAALYLDILLPEIRCPLPQLRQLSSTDVSHVTLTERHTNGFTHMVIFSSIHTVFAASWLFRVHRPRSWTSHCRRCLCWNRRYLDHKSHREPWELPFIISLNKNILFPRNKSDKWLFGKILLLEISVVSGIPIFNFRFALYSHWAFWHVWCFVLHLGLN